MTDLHMDRVLSRKETGTRKPAIYAGLAVLLTGVIAYLFWPSAAVMLSKQSVIVATVKRGPFVEFASVRGYVVPREAIYLNAVEGGRVEEVLAEPGQHVKAGDPLVRLTNTQLQLDLISREAQVAEQINNLQNTEILFAQTRFTDTRAVFEGEYQVERLERSNRRRSELMSKGATSAEALDLVRDELNYYRRVLAEAIDIRKRNDELRSAQLVRLHETVDHLTENLSITRRKLEELTIRAPADGEIIALDAKVGQTRERGQSIGQLDRQQGFKIEAQVDEFYLRQVRSGQRAQLSLSGQPTPVTVAKVYPQIESGQFKVDLTFDSADIPDGLRPGQAVQAKLQLSDAADAIVIPTGAFLQHTGGAWIYVVGNDGSLERRSIRIGRRTSDNVEVLDGLRPGERVLVSDYTDFGNAQSIRINP